MDVRVIVTYCKVTGRGCLTAVLDEVPSGVFRMQDATQQTSQSLDD